MYTTVRAIVHHHPSPHHHHTLSHHHHPSPHHHPSGPLPPCLGATPTTTHTTIPTTGTPLPTTNTPLPTTTTPLPTTPRPTTTTHRPTTTAPTTTAIPQQCVQDGVAYPVGASVPDTDDDPCTCCCYCSSPGNIVCAEVKSPRMCFSPEPPCVDAVYVPDPTQCCPTDYHCPNGPNCGYGGQIIPDGQSMDMDDGMYCSCSGGGLPWCRPTTPRPTAVTPRPTTTTTGTTNIA
ncbi:integumentary mucin C.1-like [Branchiostoma floridae]|uniref:Integumentary mucin C.1-like n=1 Tax=Branchiostoma floridae TaxID=7739 RepID=A0A9J7MSL0_BRAFL|nr:integumentary mucin C.1-like [Branchiostoma floridae]